jgi:hypothetical protein
VVVINANPRPAKVAGIVRRLIVSELSQLSPQPLWDIFAKICSIPHPSYHEEQLAEHIMGWAKEKGLHAERDQVGNILIRKPHRVWKTVNRLCCRRTWIWCRRKTTTPFTTSPKIRFSRTSTASG